MRHIGQRRRLHRAMLAVLSIGAAIGALTATPATQPATAQERPHAVLLVASKAITDPNFAEAVVLVTRQAAGGAVGVIVNRPTEARVADVLPAHDALKDRKDVVFRGGPVVRGTLVLAFRSSEPPPNGDVARVLDDVYLTLDARVIDAVLGRKDLPEFRLYAGYAGWAPGQLEAEILQGGWFVLEADAQSIFTADPQNLWSRLLLRASPQRNSAEAPDALGAATPVASRR